MDEMARLPADDPWFMVLYRRAMDIWLKELPSIPLLAWHQRVPCNGTYWKGWPTAENPYVNSAGGQEDLAHPGRGRGRRRRDRRGRDRRGRSRVQAPSERRLLASD